MHIGVPFNYSSEFLIYFLSLSSKIKIANTKHNSRNVGSSHVIKLTAALRSDLIFTKYSFHIMCQTRCQIAKITRAHSSNGLMVQINHVTSVRMEILRITPVSLSVSTGHSQFFFNKIGPLE